MKVVMISGNPVGKFYGGVKVHVKHLTSYLSNFKEIEFTLVTFGLKDIIYEKNGIDFIEIKRLNFGKYLFPLQLFYDIYRLNNAINKINPDIIHIQSTIPLFSFFGINVSNKYPTLITLHGYFKEENKFHVGVEKIFNKLFSIPLEKFALSKIPYIITVCPQIKDLIKYTTSSKIFVVPNGINLKQIQKIKPIKIKEDSTIFYIGVLTKRKGVHDLIKAISIVKSRIQNVKLYIAGTGPYLNKLKQIVRDLNLEENVIFLGFINEKEKFSYMKSLDIFVLPTYWESFPFVLLEALACGKPILTTNVAGNPFAVSNGVNGFLVKPGDWKQIAEKLIILLDDKELINRMGKKSKIKAQDFDWDIISKQTREVYLNLVSRNVIL